MAREIERSTWRTQAWKNGLGVTHEIWREPDTEDFAVRVSLAEVTASGPFSQFPGYHRWTFFVGPASIKLGEVTLDEPGHHIWSPGTAPIHAELRGGPTRLLNVLARSDLIADYGETTSAVRFRFEVAQQRAWLYEPALVCDTAGCVWVAAKG
ncbi:MAG: HutD family protein [Deltaproteobacteria bacterium]|nr:HutD family protein [Deltaproteobacteria bacterium]